MVVTPFRGLEQKVSSVAKLNLHLLTTGTSKVDYYWAYIRRSPIGLNHCMDWKVITEFLWFEDRSMYVTVDAINDVIVAKCSVFGQRMVFEQQYLSLSQQHLLPPTNLPAISLTRHSNINKKGGRRRSFKTTRLF